MNLFLTGDTTVVTNKVYWCFADCTIVIELHIISTFSAGLYSH